MLLGRQIDLQTWSEMVQCYQNWDHAGHYKRDAPQMDGVAQPSHPHLSTMGSTDQILRCAQFPKED